MKWPVIVGLGIALPALGASESSPSAEEVVVIGKRHINSAPASVQQMNKEAIESMPQGGDIALPKLLATTTPGIVEGPFGQTFVRGNHANIQYQIDGVQLPDSPSNTFGQSFSPRNIDHMEVITGGIPAEYGERLSAVVNVISKSGTEEPGATVGLSYGSYRTFTPSLEASGSSKDGGFKYYLSGSYTKTDRGLDTPQPESLTQQLQGGRQAVHDAANSDNEFAKFDLIQANDTLSLIAFNSRSHYQIPNYPSSFSPASPFFAGDFVDHWGNQGGFKYAPQATGDDQSERNRYAQLVWKHIFSADTYIQVAPYWKGSDIVIGNDLAADLTAASVIPGATASSFTEDRTTNNYGLKTDFSTHLGQSNRIKAGFQGQRSRTTGSIDVFTATAPAAGTGAPTVIESKDDGTDKGEFGAVYLQDEIAASHWLTLNIGLRYDVTKFEFEDEKSEDQALQPRLGATFTVSETTRLHLFYGKLFQPAAVENLRKTFAAVAGGQLLPYDIKAEKDDYYEAGLAQVLGDQTLVVNTWYKKAKNMIDDAQLLNTSVAQPYNFKEGYAYGTEVSLAGQITNRWSDFFNYSYEIAQGRGLSGGLFIFPSGGGPGDSYTYLDHLQMNTANAGVTYKNAGFWWTTQALYGGGLRTGANNRKSLPPHTTADTTVGYAFAKSDELTSRLKISADILNISDDRYPITVANGFNGSHYAAGREYFVHLSKEF